MKYQANEDNIGLISAIVLRQAITAAGVPHSCLIRKCRRDGGCTGPMIAGDIQADRDFLVVDPVQSPAEKMMPSCLPTCSEGEMNDINRRGKAILQRLEETPEMPMIEASRAIGARTWKTIGKINR